MPKKSPHALKVKDFISDLIRISPKTQKQISDECGFEHSNVMSMIKKGLTKLPINRVGPLAKSLYIDPAYLLRMVLIEYFPETWETIDELIMHDVLTATEKSLITQFRSATGNQCLQSISLSKLDERTFSITTKSLE